MEEAEKLLGTDLKVKETALGVDLDLTSTGDLATISDDMNLVQSILHRLRTIKSELSETGNSQYGSRIYDVVGEINNELTRERIKLIVRETLLQEPRVKEVVAISVKARHYNDNVDYHYPTHPLQTESEGSSAATSSSSFSSSGSTEDGSKNHNHHNSVAISVDLIPIGSNVPLNIVFPFYLESK